MMCNTMSMVMKQSLTARPSDMYVTLLPPRPCYIFELIINSKGIPRIFLTFQVLDGIYEKI